MRNIGINVWLAAFVVLAVVFMGWQRAEASTPQPVLSKVKVMEVIAGSGGVESKLIVYESKLHGTRPVEPGGKTKEAIVEGSHEGVSAGYASAGASGGAAHSTGNVNRRGAGCALALAAPAPQALDAGSPR